MRNHKTSDQNSNPLVSVSCSTIIPHSDSVRPVHTVSPKATTLAPRSSEAAPEFRPTYRKAFKSDSTTATSWQSRPGLHRPNRCKSAGSLTKTVARLTRFEDSEPAHLSYNSSPCTQLTDVTVDTDYIISRGVFPPKLRKVKRTPWSVVALHDFVILLASQSLHRTKNVTFVFSKCFLT